MTAQQSETIWTELFHADCLNWLRSREAASIHAVVTDPPYGMVEYSKLNMDKLRMGRGGVWRIPPAIGGSKRQPVPRFTVLSIDDLTRLERFFIDWGTLLLPTLVPGGHVFVASSPLMNHLVSHAMVTAGFEKRGEIIRLVRTLRGGDRPKGAEEEFPEISAMPRSCWEPWPIFRKPMEGTLASNLRKYGAGGLRRPTKDAPFTDVIYSSRTPRKEKQIAPHPSLKPQRFLRTLVRAALPTGQGVVLDPFAGSGSTLAACQANGFDSIGVESDASYVSMALSAIPKLAALDVDESFTTAAEFELHTEDRGIPHSTPASEDRISESRQLLYAVKLHSGR